MVQVVLPVGALWLPVVTLVFAPLAQPVVVTYLNLLKIHRQWHL
jgi:hypothetical protein